MTRNLFLQHESQLRALNERPLPEAFRVTRVRVGWGARRGFYSANAQGRLTLRISGSNHKGEAPQKVGRKSQDDFRALAASADAVALELMQEEGAGDAAVDKGKERKGKGSGRKKTNKK